MVKPWRNPQFHFLVNWSWGRMRCREVIGLPEVRPSGSDRGGHYAEILASKTMGGEMPGSIMLRQAAVQTDAGFQAWLQQARAGTLQPAGVTVSLIFDRKPPCVVWALSGAFPVDRIETTPGARDNEVKMDKILLAYEGLTVVKS